MFWNGTLLIMPIRSRRKAREIYYEIMVSIMVYIMVYIELFIVEQKLSIQKIHGPMVAQLGEHSSG